MKINKIWTVYLFIIVCISILFIYISKFSYPNLLNYMFFSLLPLIAFVFAFRLPKVNESKNRKTVVTNWIVLCLINSVVLGVIVMIYYSSINIIITGA